MVNINYFANQGCYFFIIKLLGIINVNDNKECVRIIELACFGGADENVIIGMERFQSVMAFIKTVVVTIGDDITGLAVLHHKPCHADTCAKGIKVGISVPHDNDVGAVQDVIHKLVGDRA